MYISNHKVTIASVNGSSSSAYQPGQTTKGNPVDLQALEALVLHSMTIENTITAREREREKENLHALRQRYMDPVVMFNNPLPWVLNFAVDK